MEVINKNTSRRSYLYFPSLKDVKWLGRLIESIKDLKKEKDYLYNITGEKQYQICGEDPDICFYTQCFDNTTIVWIGKEFAEKNGLDAENLENDLFNLFEKELQNEINYIKSCNFPNIKKVQIKQNELDEDILNVLIKEFEVEFK